MFVPFVLMFVVGSLLPLFPRNSTANFWVGMIAILFLLLTLFMFLRSHDELVQVHDEIHAEVAAKKEQSS